MMGRRMRRVRSVMEDRGGWKREEGGGRMRKKVVCCG